MVYVAMEGEELYLGAAGLQWEQYTQAKRITTTARDRRVASIIAHTTQAMRALRAREENAPGAEIVEFGVASWLWAASYLRHYYIHNA
jgi:hypothetical protein